MFNILLPIAYLLLMAPLLIWADHWHRFVLPAISLAFFPLWIAAELMAIFFPNTYWNKNAKRIVVAFWSLCWLGLLS